MRNKDKIHEKSINVKVYPNPANDYLILEYELPNTDNIEFSLMSSTGQKYLQNLLMLKGITIILIQKYHTRSLSSDFVNDSEQSAIGYLSEVDETVQTLIDTLEIDTILVVQTVTEAQNFNNNVLPDNAMEENEKTINNIYLNTIAIGNFEFTDSQKEIVSQISHQCPYIGGKYVFFARSILSYWMPNYYFDDKSLCNSTSRQAITQVKTKDEIPSIKAMIYPNPTKGIFTLDCNISNYSNVIVLIKDLAGKNLITKELNTKNLIHDFDSFELTNGIYILTLKSGSEILTNKRLNIMK